MASEFGVITLTASGIGINAVKEIKTNRDPYPVLLAGVVLMAVFVFLGNVRPRLGLAAAAVFFLASAIDGGPLIIQTVNQLINSKAPGSKPVIVVPATPGSSGQSGLSNSGAGKGSGGSSSGSF